MNGHCNLTTAKRSKRNEFVVRQEQMLATTDYGIQGNWQYCRVGNSTFVVWLWCLQKCICALSGSHQKEMVCFCKHPLQKIMASYCLHIYLFNEGSHLLRQRNCIVMACLLLLQVMWILRLPDIHVGWLCRYGRNVQIVVGFPSGRKCSEASLVLNLQPCNSDINSNTPLGNTVQHLQLWYLRWVKCKVEAD